MATPPPSPLAALRHRSFALFVIGSVVANVGQFMQTIAVPFLINDITDSNAWVGAAGFAVLAPALVTTPFSGALADRMSRKTLLIGSFVVQAATSATFFGLYTADLLSPWRILALQVVAGLGAGFQWAPTQSLTALLVPREHLIGAVRLVSVGFTAGRTIGPAGAGIIIAIWGPGPAFAVTMTGFAVGTLLFLPMRPRRADTGQQRSVLRHIARGFRYVAHRPSMLLIVRTSLVIAMLGATFGQALAAAVADDAFGVGGGGLGLLVTMFGAGSVVVGVYVTRHGDRHRRSEMELAAASTFAVAVLVIASTPWFAVGLVGYFLLGMGQMVHGVTMNSTLQVQVEDEYRGRVTSVWLMALLTGLPLGALVGGALGDVIGIRWVLAMFGCLLAAFVAWTAIRHDRFRPLDLDSAPTEAQLEASPPRAPA